MTQERMATAPGVRRVKMLHFRPAKDDVVVYCPERDELRIHAGTKGERELYRCTFGMRLFGDDRYFSERKAFNLEPLRSEGAKMLEWDGDGQVVRIVLREIEVAYRGGFNEVVIRQYVRNCPGVYALYRRGKLYDVGLASNLPTRLGHHLKDRHSQSWDRFSVYLTIGDTHLRELESLVLRIVKTKGNKQKGKFIKSEDLLCKCRRDVREYRRLELFGLPPRTKPVEPITSQEARAPILAEYISGPMKLRAKYKGQTLHATVARNGTIRFNGKLYTSPSLAGADAGKHPTCNGWTFWQFERAPGDWVLLDELRK